MANEHEISAHKSKNAPPKLKLLFTVVNRDKAELFTTLIQPFEANLQLSISARGTASTEMLRLFGFTDYRKAVVISVIREDNEDAVLRFLEEKFETVKNGKGIAFTASMTSVIGVAIYQFLSNKA